MALHLRDRQQRNGRMTEGAAAPAIGAAMVVVAGRALRLGGLDTGSIMTMMPRRIVSDMLVVVRRMIGMAVAAD